MRKDLETDIDVIRSAPATLPPSSPLSANFVVSRCLVCRCHQG